MITTLNSQKLRLSSLGNLLSAGQYNITSMHTAPASAVDTGTLGEVRITATYILCLHGNKHMGKISTGNVVKKKL